MEAKYQSERAAVILAGGDGTRLWNCLLLRSWPKVCAKPRGSAQDRSRAHLALAFDGGLARQRRRAVLRLSYLRAARGHAHLYRHSQKSAGTDFDTLKWPTSTLKMAHRQLAGASCR